MARKNKANKSNKDILTLADMSYKNPKFSDYFTRMGIYARSKTPLAGVKNRYQLVTSMKEIPDNGKYAFIYYRGENIPHAICEALYLFNVIPENVDAVIEVRLSKFLPSTVSASEAEAKLAQLLDNDNVVFLACDEWNKAAFDEPAPMVIIEDTSDFSNTDYDMFVDGEKIVRADLDEELTLAMTKSISHNEMSHSVFSVLGYCGFADPRNNARISPVHEDPDEMKGEVYQPIYDIYSILTGMKAPVHYREVSATESTLTEIERQVLLNKADYNDFVLEDISAMHHILDIITENMTSTSYYSEDDFSSETYHRWLASPESVDDFSDGYATFHQFAVHFQQYWAAYQAGVPVNDIVA